MLRSAAHPPTPGVSTYTMDNSTLMSAGAGRAGGRVYRWLSAIPGLRDRLFKV